MLVVDYPGLVRRPEEWINRIREFVGVPMNSVAMQEAIRPDLHRNR